MDEYQYRFSVFEENYNKVKLNNENKISNVVLELNQFAFYT